MLKQIFSENKKRIAIGYSLFTIENIIALCYPLILGMTIDKMIKKEYYFIFYLVSFLFIFMLSSFIRRRCDTRIFTSIFRKKAIDYVNTEHDKETETSTIIARTNMLSSITGFFEYDIPVAFYAIFSIVGSLIIILLNYNISIFFIVLFCVFPIIFVSNKFSKLLGVKNKEFNDLSETEMDTISSKNKINIKHYFIIKNLLLVRISDLDAENSLYTDIINNVMIVSSLVIFTILTNNPTIGIIMSLYQYLTKFYIGVSYIPNLLVRYTNLKDVLNRLN